jgi:hypothetical protein
MEVIYELILGIIDLSLIIFNRKLHMGMGIEW